MPTYIVTAPEQRLSQSQKNRLAAEITRVHCEVTGAPPYFAQVIFVDVQEGNYFMGGKPLEGDRVFIHGRIRDGRTPEQKNRLLMGMMDAAATVADMPKSQVAVYIVDVPAQQIAEYGQPLPGAGEEARWTASLPTAVRERMQAVGR
jgi:phenylpyruvate tautomerase PptA (4-oxalocrotonate tautomerase family)